MEINLEIGATHEISKIVKPEDSAIHYASGALDVFASPAMFGMMEQVAQIWTQEQLPEGYSTVGIHLDVSHKAPTPIGMKITTKSELIEQDGKKLVFKVTAYDEVEEVGVGTHTRYIVNFEKFSEKALSKGKK